MKKILGYSAVSIVLLLSILLINTMMYIIPERTKTKPVEFPTDRDAALQKFSKGITFKTIAYDPGEFEAEELLKFHEHLKVSYPELHSTLKLEIINEYSLLYTWTGLNESLDPILFNAHQDVVPVEEGTENEWSYPPFGGKIADGRIWGRGALDTKVNVFAIMESIEALVKEGYQPKRTIMVAFGHDEEVGGAEGGAKIAQTLHDRNIKLDFMTDEGLFIVNDMYPGVDKPIAMIGTSEKGYVSYRLRARSEGGHSSYPPKQTSIGVISEAITKLEANPFPAHMNFAIENAQKVIPYMSFFQKILFANSWLFSPILENIFSAASAPSATIRTTTAATIFNSGTKDNILPQIAEAVVNFRIFPGETAAEVEEYIIKTIDNDKIEIEEFSFNKKPSPVSDAESDRFQLLEKTLHQISNEEIIVSPNLLIGSTDSKHYLGLTDNIYRFVPASLFPEDLKLMHGTNESITVDNYLQVITYFYWLIKNSDGLE